MNDSWLRALFVTTLVCACFARISAQEAAQTSTAEPPAGEERRDDREAIRDVLASFAKSFGARDPQALAAHFTDDGELHNVQGVTLRGRTALEDAFAAFFERTPEVTAEIAPDNLRFLSDNAAIDEGVVRVQRGPTDTASVARYSAFLVRKDGPWQVAMMSESPIFYDAAMSDLDWLIGTWKSTSGSGAEIETTYAWDAAQTFIRMEFRIQETNLAASGTQIIGLDPASGMIHSWTFEANGGIGEADWTRDGDHWVLDAAGTLADGSTLTETNVLRRIDENTFTWQSVDRTLDGAELADLAPVKVSRVVVQE